VSSGPEDRLRLALAVLADRRLLQLIDELRVDWERASQDPPEA
jgi:hypothetical protein